MEMNKRWKFWRIYVMLISSLTWSIRRLTQFNGLFNTHIFMDYVIFHKRERVFYQGLQTRENNENHEAVNQVILIVLECL